MKMKQRGVVLLGALAIVWVVAAVGMVGTGVVISHNDSAEVVSE